MPDMTVYVSGATALIGENEVSIFPAASWTSPSAIIMMQIFWQFVHAWQTFHSLTELPSTLSSTEMGNGQLKSQAGLPLARTDQR